MLVLFKDLSNAGVRVPKVDLELEMAIPLVMILAKWARIWNLSISEIIKLQFR